MALNPRIVSGALKSYNVRDFYLTETALRIIDFG